MVHQGLPPETPTPGWRCHSLSRAVDSSGLLSVFLAASIPGCLLSALIPSTIALLSIVIIIIQFSTFLLFRLYCVSWIFITSLLLLGRGARTEYIVWPLCYVYYRVKAVPYSSGPRNQPSIWNSYSILLFTPKCNVGLMNS